MKNEISKIDSWKGKSRAELNKHIGSNPNSPKGKLLQSPSHLSEAGNSDGKRSTSSVLRFIKMTDRYNLNGFRMQPTFYERTRQWIFSKGK